MTLETFVDQWKELEDTTRLVGSMRNRRDNAPFFADSYAQLRAHVGAPLNTHPFPQYAEFDEETIQTALLHAQGYTLGIEEYTLAATRADFGGMLDGVRTKLGDDNLVGYVSSYEVRANAPTVFVNRVKAFKEVIKPLSRDNPQPGVIKAKLIQKIDDAVGANPDAKTAAVARALKGIYDSERAAASVYGAVFVKPVKDAVKTAIGAGDEWKSYMEANIDRHSRDEQVEIYSDMFKRFR